MEKNNININELPLDKRIKAKYQISNSEAGFTRVIGLHEYIINDFAEFIHIKAKTYYFTSEGKYLPELTHETLNDGMPWIIENVRKIPVLTPNLQPVPNPDYNEEEPITGDNYPVLMGNQFDVYSALIHNKEFPVSLVSALERGIANDDANGCFNHRNH